MYWPNHSTMQYVLLNWPVDGIASWSGALLLISVALNFIHTVGRPLCVSLSFFALVCDKRKERVEGTNANYHHHNLSFRQPTPAPLAFNWPCGSATDDDVNTCCHPQHVTETDRVHHQWMNGMCTPTLEELLYIIPCRLGCWNNKTIASTAAA